MYPKGRFSKIQSHLTTATSEATSDCKDENGDTTYTMGIPATTASKRLRRRDWNSPAQYVLCCVFFVAFAVVFKNPIQKHLCCKQEWAQVTEQLKGVKSLWGQDEKLYQPGCVELQHTKQVYIMSLIHMPW